MIKQLPRLTAAALVAAAAAVTAVPALLGRGMAARMHGPVSNTQQ